MKKDWKDALSSLRENMGDNSVESVEEENISSSEDSEDKKIQKTPLLVVTDKKGRNGKIATIIEGFTIEQQEVENIARQLKQKLGVGGSVRDGEILIQGDHKNAVVLFLQSLNFKTK